jgi:hypothetical protein
LAKVLVGAIPIETGIPVHCPTFFLKSIENLFNFFTPFKSKKASSIEYISIAAW